MKSKINLDVVPAIVKKQYLANGSIEARAGSYYGGSRKRRQSTGWQPGGGDADSDTLADLETLRERSRDLLRNQPIAAGAINTNCINVVGSGLKMQSRIDRGVLGMDVDPAEEWQRNTEREWKSWANNLDCSLDRGGNFADITSLVFRSALESGDVFALLAHKVRSTSPYGLKVQLIEADRVRNEGDARDTVNLTAGVEKDDFGSPHKYHISTTHPGTVKTPYERKWEKRNVFTKSGRRNIIHVYEKLRPDQTRGVPYLAPVTELLKQLGKFTNAEIAAAVINAYFTVFVKSPAGTTGLATFQDSAETGGKASDKDYKLGMGSVARLSPGEEIEFADPKRPNQNFEPFVEAIFRQIGTALGLPFEVLVQHFQKSYSAARTSMLLAWKMFNTRRSWLVNHFCNPVYEAWLEEAVLRGRVAAPGFLDDPIIRQAYLGNTWIGPSPGQIDPVKETKAAGDRLAIPGLTTIAGEAAAIGEDFDQNIEQRAREEKLIKDLGLPGVFAAMSPDSPEKAGKAENDKRD